MLQRLRDMPARRSALSSTSPLDYSEVVMSLSVVHYDDVTRAELGHEASADPAHESLAVRGLEERAESQPAMKTHCTDHR